MSAVSSSSTAFTGSQRTASALMGRLESGMVGINRLGVSNPETPFGGVKGRGHGREGGIEGLRAYQNVKFIARM